MEDHLIKDINEFQLRTKNALILLGITRISNLTELSESDLRFIHGIGKKGRQSILEFCLKNEIKLSDKSYYIDS